MPDAEKTREELMQELIDQLDRPAPHDYGRGPGPAVESVPHDYGRGPAPTEKK